MSHVLLNPGPVNVSERVRAALSRGDACHREPEVAESLNRLASLYRRQSRYAEAEPLYQESCEIWKKSLGEEHEDVGTSYNNLVANTTINFTTFDSQIIITFTQVYSVSTIVAVQVYVVITSTGINNA